MKRKRFSVEQIVFRIPQCLDALLLATLMHHQMNAKHQLSRRCCRQYVSSRVLFNTRHGVAEVHFFKKKAARRWRPEFIVLCLSE